MADASPNLKIKKAEVQIMSKQTSAEVKEDTAEVKKDTAQVKEDTAEVKKDTPQVKEDTAEVMEDTAEVKKDTAEVKKDTAQVRKDTAQVKEDTAEVKKDTAQVKEDTAEVKKDTAQVKEDTAEVMEDTAEVKKDTAQVKEATAQVKEDTAQVKEDTAQVKENTAQVKEDTAEVKKDTAQVKEDTAQVKEDTAQVKEDTAQVKVQDGTKLLASSETEESDGERTLDGDPGEGSLQDGEEDLLQFLDKFTLDELYELYNLLYVTENEPLDFPDIGDFNEYQPCEFYDVMEYARDEFFDVEEEEMEDLDISFEEVADVLTAFVGANSDSEPDSDSEAPGRELSGSSTQSVDWETGNGPEGYESDETYFSIETEDPLPAFPTDDEATPHAHPEERNFRLGHWWRVLIAIMKLVPKVALFLNIVIVVIGIFSAITS